MLECRDCRFVFCDPLPQTGAGSSGEFSVLTEAEYSQALLDLTPRKMAHYDEIAERRHATYTRALGRRNFRLLEIGCGTAGLAHRYEQLGVQYRGIDIDRLMVDDCRRRGMTTVTHSDFMALEDGRFDVICASQVLEHIIAPRAFVSRAAKLLNPAGIIHVDVPNHDALAGLLATALRRPNRFNGIEVPHHSFAYRKRTLHTLFNPAFEVAVFDVNPPHRTWGQAHDVPLAFRALYAVSGAAGLGSILVAMGRKRAANDGDA